MAGQNQDDHHKHTFSSFVRIRDVALKTCQRWWTIGKSGERGSGISVLVARQDDIYIYIYIYIYMRVCMCVWVCICLVGCGCRIHWLLLCRGVRLPLNECPRYDAKQSDSEVAVMLELWGMRSTPSLLSLPGPLGPGVVASDSVLSMGKIEQQCVLTLNWNLK